MFHEELNCESGVPCATAQRTAGGTLTWLSDLKEIITYPDLSQTHISMGMMGCRMLLQLRDNLGQ